MVRLAVRRQHPGATVENNEAGILMTLDGKKQECNLRNLFMEYNRSSKDKDEIIARWIRSLVVDIPDHGWMDAQITLRPTIKHLEYIGLGHANMQRHNPPDSLPFSPFIGELGVIIMRDLPGTVVAVTQANLDAWGVTFEEAMYCAINNMNMLPFPTVTNALIAGGSSKKGDQEEVGVVFEGDHLTATWLLIERFRDYLAQRLQGDYVAFIPIRGRMVAIRADEPGLIGQIQQNNRGFSNQNYALTSQCYHISGATTGGIVTVHKTGLNQGERITLDNKSMFARGNSATLPTPGVQPQMGMGGRQSPVDLSSWGGLSESTSDDSNKVRTPFDQGRR